MNFAEQNVANAYDYAQKLLEAKDLRTLFALHGEYINAQTQMFREQATTVRDVAYKVAAEFALHGEYIDAQAQMFREQATTVRDVAYKVAAK